MVTRKDVAERAGVSVTIVSRALNNSGYVAREKREAVIRAAQELGYRISPALIADRDHKTRQILFFSKDLTNAFNIELYQGMLQYARRYDYMVHLSGTLSFEKIKGMAVDGIILPNEYMAYQYVKDVGKSFDLPVVCAAYSDIEKPPKFMPYIISDAYVATEMLINHLRGRGHQKIALATPYHLYVSQSRHIAYITMMRPVLGGRLEEYVFNNCKDDDTGFQDENYRQEGEITAKAFAASGIDATAVICFNDDFAIGMCAAFRRLGLKVPDDVSVVGIDNISVGRYIAPTLTTVDIFPARQGAECVRVLLDMIEGGSVPARINLPLRLVEGESVRDLVK